MILDNPQSTANYIAFYTDTSQKLRMTIPTDRYTLPSSDKKTGIKPFVYDNLSELAYCAFKSPNSDSTHTLPTKCTCKQCKNLLRLQTQLLKPGTPQT